MDDERPIFRRYCRLTHCCPIARRELDLLVLVADEDGEILSMPYPVFVTRATYHADDPDRRRMSVSFRDGTLCQAASGALLREFCARLWFDRPLRRWLVQATIDEFDAENGLDVYSVGAELGHTGGFS